MRLSLRLSRLFVRLLAPAGLALAFSLSPAPSDAATKRNTDTEKVHVVANGQTLAKIAKRYRVSVQELREVNDLAAGQRLHSGMRLVIPSEATRERAQSARDARDDDRKPSRKKGKTRNARHDRDDDDDDRDDDDDDRRGKKGKRSSRDDDRDDVRDRRSSGRETGAHSGRTGGVVKSGHVRLVHGSTVWEGKVFDKKGKISPRAIDGFTRMLSSSGGKRHPINPRLVALVAEVSDHFGGRTIEVVSGFRPQTSTQHTPHSKHNLGDAIDMHVRGVDNQDLRDFCKSFRNTGVGYYPNSSFVHLDVRDVSTFWVDFSKPGEAPRYDRPDQAKDGDEAHGDGSSADAKKGSDDAKKPAADDAKKPDDVVASGSGKTQDPVPASDEKKKLNHGSRRDDGFGSAPRRSRMTQGMPEMVRTSSDALVARRRRVAEQLGGQPALLAAGLPRARNYAAWTYPFRATSHFLYLLGCSLPGAALLLEAGRATLFAEPPGDDDALWHGPTPGWDELRAATGVDAIRPLSELPSALPRGVATLPPQEGATARWLSQLLGRSVEENGGARLADDGADARLADAMIAVRLVHDDAALAQMRAAALATAEAHEAGARASRTARVESEIRAAMESAMARHRMGTAYGPIVTVHGEVLHNERQDGAVAPGDLVLADVGAESWEGWACDVTRVWPSSGALSTTQRALYEVVHRAQRAAIAHVAPGVRYREVHHVARRTLVDGLVALGILRGDPAELDARGAGDLFFPHGVGHLLGLDVHDMEDLGDRAGYAKGRTRVARFGERYLRLDRDLAPGMAVTIEPGFYQVPAILEDARIVGDLEAHLVRSELARYADVRGIRLEDDVLVTASGHEVLTAAIPFV